MGCSPVHKRSKLASREAVWQAIRKADFFTVKDLYMTTRLGKDTIREFVRGLVNADYIELVRIDGREKVYRLLRRDIATPRVRQDGSQVTQGAGREQMWRTMRIIKKFTPPALAVASSTEEHPVAANEALSYIGFLCKAGYLARVQEPTSSTPACYQFVPSRFTGPRAPQIQRIKQVFDPNTNEVVWSKGNPL